MLQSLAVKTRTRGEQRRALRRPFLLTIVAVVLGVIGLTQLDTPMTQLFAFAAPTPTATATPLPTSTLTATPTRTQTPTRTPTATPSSTATATDSPTANRQATRQARATQTAAAPTVTLTPTASVTPLPVARSARVPILMYHHIGDLPPDADALRKSLTVSSERFDEQMRFLAEQGYTTIHIADLVNYFQTGAPLPEKPIILTFDDGYDDAYFNVFPTLKDFGFKGTFFIIGAPTDYGSPGYMRWENVLELSENGMEIGAHSLTHRYNLGQFRASIQDSEIIKGNQLMVDHLPNWTPLFSYPSGSYNQYTLDLLKQSGYAAAVTTKQGALQTSQAPLELRRIRIRGEWNISQFAYWFNYWSSRP